MGKTAVTFWSPTYRILGFFFAAFGLFILGLDFYPNPGETSLNQWFLSIFFGGLFAFMGLLNLFRATRVRLDPATQTYIYHRGIFPFARRYTGPFDDFDHILLHLERRSAPRYKIMKYKTVLVVSLIWRDPRRTSIILRDGTVHFSGERARKKGRVFAARLAGIIPLATHDHLSEKPIFIAPGQEPISNLFG